MKIRSFLASLLLATATPLLAQDAQGMPKPGAEHQLLAAKAAGVTRVLIPKDNVRDLRDVPKSVRETIVIVPVGTMDEVLVHALAASATEIFRGPGAEEAESLADGPAPPVPSAADDREDDMASTITDD